MQSMRRRGPAALALAGTLGLTLGLVSACGDDSTATDPTAGGSQAPATSAPPAPSRAEQNITLAQPAEGAAVTKAFVASGKANSPEANVPWSVQDSGGRTVLHGAATAAGWMDRLYPWQANVDVSKLSPGTYTFVARTDDPSGGEGKPPEKVGATIRVQ